VPEGAFAALGTTRSNWESLLLHSPPFAVPLYFLRFRRHLLSAAEHATDLMPGWYPDQTTQPWSGGSTVGPGPISVANARRTAEPRGSQPSAGSSVNDPPCNGVIARKQRSSVVHRRRVR